MKDVLRRLVIIALFLLLVCGGIFIANEKLKYLDENEPNINIQNTTVVENKLEEQKKDYEELNNIKAKTNSNLNLRDEPNETGSIILTIPKDDILGLQVMYNNGWYKVLYNQNSGYVSGEYVSVLTDEEVSEITVDVTYDNTYAIVNVNDSLNIRAKANKEATSLTYVKAESILRVYEKMQNNWYKVEGNAIEGYVSGEYIKILTEQEYESYSSKINNLLDPDKNIIATYTSTSTYNKNSRYNMHLAADYQNGVIVKPGETYSHLKVVHPEGVENIYVDSTIFVGNGQTAQASGGGICQTSSTTYAAIASAEEKGIKTGLNVTAQAPHSGKVNYVPRKYEATVSSGSQDFCFRNCNDYSIKIVTSYDYNTLTVTIYKL